MRCRWCSAEYRRVSFLSSAALSAFAVSCLIGVFALQGCADLAVGVAGPIANVLLNVTQYYMQQLGLSLSSRYR
jgi:hypothetical protein